MSVLESTNGINIRRPRREGQHQVIYRECDSDDEDFETVLLLQGLVQAAKQGTKPAAGHPSEPLPPLSPLQLELRGICRLGDKEALKTFLANNPEINLDFKDPSGEFLDLTFVTFSLNTFRNELNKFYSQHASL